jgi:hypothetical protein
MQKYRGANGAATARLTPQVPLGPPDRVGIAHALCLLLCIANDDFYRASGKKPVPDLIPDFN